MTTEQMETFNRRINNYKISETDGMLVRIETQRQLCELMREMYYDRRKYTPQEISNVYRKFAKCEREISKALCEKLIEVAKKEVD